MSNPQETKPPTAAQGGTSYYIGSVAAGAQVAQGEHIQQIQRAFAGTPDGDQLAQQFGALIETITEAKDLDAVNRQLALTKTRAVAEQLAQPNKSPQGLVAALTDAQVFLSHSARWAWERITTILQSEPAQKTLSTITEAAARGAIKSLTGA